MFPELAITGYPPEDLLLKEHFLADARAAVERLAAELGEAFAADLERSGREESGYSELQATRPQTVGYGLVDSPAGLCAWIVEKFWAWTDCDGHPENILGRDELLDNVMLYWTTATATSMATNLNPMPTRRDSVWA